MTTVAEALAVLEDAAVTRRARTALSALQSEIESTRRTDDSESSSEEPKFPDATSVAEDGDDQERQGRATAGDGQGPATARKGS